MALFNPMRIFIVPFLFIVTAPLAIFAGITTFMAFSVLLFQVLSVYFELFLSVFPAYMTGRRSNHQSRDSKAVSPTGSGSSSPITTITTITTTRTTTTGSPQRRRRPSSASIVSIGGSTTPTSEAGLGLIPSVGADRDFEGVGGWRVGGDNDAWRSINPRLEMSDHQHHLGQHSGKGHHRAFSGPSAHGIEGGMLMMKGRTRSPEKKSQRPVSPNSSRARAPIAVLPAFTTLDGDSCYSAVSPKATKKGPWL